MRPQEQIAGEARRYVRVRGKEQKDGGRPTWLDLRLAFDIGLRGTGERKREGIKSLGLHNELGFSDLPSVIDFGI